MVMVMVMVGRRLITSSSKPAVSRHRHRHQHQHLFYLFNTSSSTPLAPVSHHHHPPCFFSPLGVLCKVFDNGSTRPVGILDGPFLQSACLRNMMHKAGEEVNKSENVAAADGKGNATLKKKKLKGKRAVVRWLKFFRWKKKKDYERMTAEEKILYKLKKARNKEARLMEALEKIEPPDSSEPIHDPEILTPEEHFYFLKMGIKCKNYVPVGRRGIYQGVILNMHLHWKKHQTLKVVVKTFTPEEVKEIASELARLSGGIVLDIQEDSTIIMYRGKNYSQPPTEIMSPKSTLPRIKALNKSKYRDGLRAVRKFIPRLEHDLDLLQQQAKRKQETRSEYIENIQETENAGSECGDTADQQPSRYSIGKRINRNSDLDEESTSEAGITSDSDCLSDIFETDSDEEVEKEERPLYLDEFEKIPAERDEDEDGFEEHLRQISQNSKKGDHVKKDVDLPDLDEVDRIFLRAGSLLRKKRR